MAECKNVCTFRLTKFRKIHNITCTPPAGKEGLPTDYCEKLVKEAADRAEKPNPDRLAENAKCDPNSNCRCFPVGEPKWEKVREKRTGMTPTYRIQKRWAKTRSYSKLAAKH
jgi:hypothetical protein